MVVAGLSRLFDPSVAWWRLLRVAADATAALAVWGLVRREAGERWALAGWLAAAVTVAQPTSANPFPVGARPRALRRARGRARAARRGRAAGGAGGVLAPGHRAGRGAGGGDRGHARRARGGRAARPRGGGARRALLAAGAALAAGVVLYLPFAVAAGPGRLFDELVGIAAGDGALWRLPFPLAYDGPLRAWPPSALAEDLKDVLGFYLPLAALVLGAVVVAARLRAPPAAVAGARRRARAVLRLRGLPALAARRPARAAAGRVPVRGDPAGRRLRAAAGAAGRRSRPGSS